MSNSMSDFPALIQGNFSDKDFESLIRFTLGRRSSRTMWDSGSPQQSLEKLFLWLSQQGRLTAALMIQAMLQARPEPQRLQDFCRLYFPDLLEPVRSDALIASTAAGLSTLATFSNDFQIRSQVMAQKTIFATVQRQIIVMDCYKGLHDVIHQLALQHGAIEDAIRRAKSDLRARLGLSGYSFDLRRLANQARDKTSGLESEDSELEWIARLEACAGIVSDFGQQAGSEITVDKILEVHDNFGLILSQGARISNVLALEADRLQLEQLASLIENILRSLTCRGCNVIPIPGELASAPSSVNALRARLAGLVTEHFEWQRLSANMESIRGTRSFLPGRGRLSENFIGSIEQLLNLFAGVSWAQDLCGFWKSYCESRKALDVADPCPEQFDIVEMAFDAFYRAFTWSFYDVDRRLLELCRKITGIAEPIERLSTAMVGDAAAPMYTSAALAGNPEPSLDGGTQMKPKHQEFLARVFVSQAYATKLGKEKEYFISLIQKAYLKQPDLQQAIRLLRDDPVMDSRALISWALTRGKNPADGKFTTLGSLLKSELDELPVDQASAVAAIIVADKLFLDTSLIDELRSRFQVPLAADPADFNDQGMGPDFNWQAPSDLELQSFLAREPPDFLDVGFLQGAMTRVRSVCLVTVGQTGGTGTGVLIGPDHVLTNYHVLAPRSDISPEQVAGSVVLQFGKFTGSSSSNVVSINLSANAPITAVSPTRELDFALLRLEGNLHSVANVQVSPFVLDIPQVGSTINILQHPAGRGMKLAVSDNSVTYSKAEAGVVQYVTRTAAGSSGSPCFDDRWRLVALHHAERAKTFGAIREGILMKAIHEHIAPHLGSSWQAD